MSALNHLYEVVSDRRVNPQEGSYTCYLFDKGLDKILKKVGEESAETIIASKNMSESEILYEMADLWYHCMVLLAFHGIEPMKLLGRVENGVIVNAEGPSITAQCLRVPCSNGHMAAVFASFAKKPSKEEILERWASFKGRPQELGLPSAPKQFLQYFTEDNRPQTKLDRMREGGMGVNIGRLREDTQYDYKFVCLSHNTLRGAAGGAVLLAELLCAEGWFDR